MDARGRAGGRGGRGRYPTGRARRPDPAFRERREGTLKCRQCERHRLGDRRGAATNTRASGTSTPEGGAIKPRNLNLTAAANGNAAVPAFSSLEPLGGTISVTGIANLVTSPARSGCWPRPGRIAGGRYKLDAGTDVTMSHAAPIGGGFTIDAADLFVFAGGDLIVGRRGHPEQRYDRLARRRPCPVAGQLRGNAIVLRRRGARYRSNRRAWRRRHGDDRCEVTGAPAWLVHWGAGDLLRSAGSV